MAKKSFADRMRENIEESIAQGTHNEPDASKRPGTNQWYWQGAEGEQIEQARDTFARGDAVIARWWARLRGK